MQKLAFFCKNISMLNWMCTRRLNKSLTDDFINPFKPTGFFHPYYLEESILHFRGVSLIFLH